METKAEVVEIVKNIGSVFQLKNYPEEDLYLEVFLSFIPFRIERGNDEFYYGKGYETKSQRHLWYVIKRDNREADIYIKKGFEDIRSAIDETFKEYKKEIKKDMDELEKSIHLMNQVKK